MSVLFADGFDNYLVQDNLWDFPGTDCAIRLNTGDARTGIGCIQVISAAFGPSKSLGLMTDLLACLSWKSSSNGECLRFDQTLFPPGSNGPNVRCVVNADGSITFWNGNIGANLGSTAPNLVIFNTYVSIAVRVTNFTALTGRIRCWINGVLVFDQSGLHTAYDITTPWCNSIRIMGPGGIAPPPGCFIDDFYLLDCTTSPNDDFLGALKIYALPPTANANVHWTPLAGTNWSEVNEVPPDGDTSYVFADSPGDTDQYVYPLTGPPAGSTLLFVQHELDMKVDSGSRSVASNLEGFTSSVEVALSNNYHIYANPYDTNPATLGAFVAADFPLDAGPEVTR